MQVREIPRSQSKEWVFDGRRLHHVSGGFFSIVGAALYTGGERQPHLDQPLIDQPEVGILGFLTRTTHAPPRILLQAKPEPGNIALVQAAPTVQATESNYRRRHRGKDTAFLEHFLSPGTGSVHSDSLQSEQGTRFLRKYNRNMLVEAPGEDSLPGSPTFAWFPLPELLPLLLQDFQVNTDARSVLTSSPWRLLAGGPPFGRWRGRGGLGEAFLRSFEAPDDESVLRASEIIDRLHRLRTTADFTAAVVGLTDLAGWEITDTAISPARRGAFDVRHFAIETSAREVTSWDQPLVASPVEGRALLLCQERAGVLHFLFDARPEIGFGEKFQYGPTIQEPGDDPPIIPSRAERTSALRRALDGSETLMTSRHSDEGGRFFRCISRYSICLVPPGEPIDPGNTLSWMTLRQIQVLVPHRGLFSNEARSVISMLLAYL